MRRHTSALMLTLAVALAALASAGSAAAFLTGIGDNNPLMFTSPYYKALHTRIARYVAAYDVAYRPRDLAVVNAWIAAAEAQGVQPLIAFYHSRVHATQMPSYALYSRDVKRFMTLHPEIQVYSAWNEANRGNVTIRGGGSFHSPNPAQAATYYMALKHDCPHCTIVGLDVLDSDYVESTLRYIHEFDHYLHGHTPRIWGLHNYSDTNRFRDLGTRAVVDAVPGQIWLTETGGLVSFGGAFPNYRGSGLTRAKQAITFMFRLAASNPRIRRLYIFNWYGLGSGARFDSGLMDVHGKPRPAYAVVRKELTGR